eukprot:m.964 g.964  ORF g.964 m.964 type:complete len:458 (+) comp1550_c0_seq1:462-1835(+)
MDRAFGGCNSETVFKRDGSFNLNGITCYMLTGPALEVFKECSRHIDKSLPASASLAQLCKELPTSPALDRLTADERCMLMVEVGSARLATLQLNPMEREPVFRLVRKELAMPAVSSDVKVYGDCLLDLRKCMFYVCEPEVDEVMTHALLKGVIRKAKAIVDPNLNAVCLKRWAWRLLAHLFVEGSLNPRTVLKVCKKDCLLALKSAAHTRIGLCVAPWFSPTILPNPAERHVFVAEYCRKGFAMMTPESASAISIVMCLFLTAASIECPRCRHHFQYCLECDPKHKHKTSNVILPFPDELERELVLTLPDCMVLRHRQKWVSMNKERLTMCLNSSVLRNDLQLQTRCSDLVGFHTALEGAFAIQQCLNLYHCKFLAHRNVLQAAIQTVVSYSHTESACTSQNAWRLNHLHQQLDQYFAVRWGRVCMTLDDLLDRYRALDKNVIRGMVDIELLPLLGF